MFDYGFLSHKFLWKTPCFNFVGNKGLYSIGKGIEKTHLKLLGREFRGSLATWPKSRSDSQNPVWQRFFKFKHELLMWPFRELAFVSQSRAGCELVTNSSFSQNLHQALTHNSYIKSHKNTGKWLNRITIKFYMELKPR